MTEGELVAAVALELQAMATAGENVASLLRRVQQMVGREDCKLVGVQCFRKAFNAGVASISPIAGWRGFGGELSDAQVDALLLPVLEDYRRESSQ